MKTPNKISTKRPKFAPRCSYAVARSETQSRHQAGRQQASDFVNSTVWPCPDLPEHHGIATRIQIFTRFYDLKPMSIPINIKRDIRSTVLNGPRCFCAAELLKISEEWCTPDFLLALFACNKFQIVGREHN